MAEKKRVGVVLFQLGGPDSRAAVKPFLYNLFCDPDIIPLGPLGIVLREPLAWYISSRRAKFVAEHYDRIGGHSPIRHLTERQRDRLAAALAPHLHATVVIAMRYWHPLTSEAVETIRRSGPLDEIVLLPLYPHYSYATTLSSLKEWRRARGQAATSANGSPPERLVEHFYNRPLYIQALVEKISAVLRQFSDSTRTHLVFSAHGLPMSLVNRGDPYPRQVEETVRLVRERGSAQIAGWPRPHVLCYQSRVGRAKWLEPPLTGTIERLAREGVREMLVVPISFVTEHIETLHEINIEAREEAEKLGVKIFRMMPAVGDSPLFISALADLVLRAVGIVPSNSVTSVTEACLTRALPPGSCTTEVNGKVEQNHKTDSEEFYQRKTFRSRKEVARELKRLEREYNEDRPHLALKEKTPAERVRELAQLIDPVRNLC